MARTFVLGGSQTLSNTSFAPVTIYPCTVGCFFKTTNPQPGSNQNFLTISNNTNFNDQIGFGIDNATGKAEGFCSDSSSNFSVDTVGPLLSSNVWYAIVYVMASAVLRTTFLLGPSGFSVVSSTTSRVSGASCNQTILGGFQTVGSNTFGGQLAKVVCWSNALYVPEVLDFMRGKSPDQIRPGAIMAWWKMNGGLSPEPEWQNRGALLLTGAPMFSEDPLSPPQTNIQQVRWAFGSGVLSPVTWGWDKVFDAAPTKKASATFSEWPVALPVAPPIFVNGGFRPFDPPPAPKRAPPAFAETIVPPVAPNSAVSGWVAWSDLVKAPPKFLLDLVPTIGIQSPYPYGWDRAFDPAPAKRATATRLSEWPVALPVAPPTFVNGGFRPFDPPPVPPKRPLAFDGVIVPVAQVIVTYPEGWGRWFDQAPRSAPRSAELGQLPATAAVLPQMGWAKGFEYVVGPRFRPAALDGLIVPASAPAAAPPFGWATDFERAPKAKPPIPGFAETVVPVAQFFVTYPEGWRTWSDRVIPPPFAPASFSSFLPMTVQLFLTSNPEYILGYSKPPIRKLPLVMS